MPENNRPHATLAEQGREIIEELARLREALALKERTTVNECPGGLMLLRLCSGLTLEEWDEMTRDGQFPHWLALPASGDAAPHLERIQRTMDELAHETRHDPLTGLANRRAFEKTLRMELERAHRAGTNLSLALFDLD